MAAQAQVRREHLTDKQYEAFSKMCQFIYDMNMERYISIEKIAAMNSDEKIEALKDLMLTVTEPFKLLLAMLAVIDPVALKIAMQKAD